MTEKEQREKHEHYKAGVASGIAYATEYLMGRRLRDFQLKSADAIIDEAIKYLIEQYHK